MFVQDHRRDFDAVLTATEPFALVRFGDGEAAVLEGRAHAAANGEWRSHGEHWLRVPLRHSLVRNAAGYCVGMPPPCCLFPIRALAGEIQAPWPQRTFATLFLHGNLDRTRELVERLSPIIVGTMGDIVVPVDGMDRGCDLDAIVRDMLGAQRPMLVSAGPLANVLIDRYWQLQAPEKRQIVLDVGSALDRYLTGQDTRYYHHGRRLRHHCSFRSGPLQDVSPPVVKGTAMLSNRLVVGRAGQGHSAVLGGAGQSRRPANPVAVGASSTSRTAGAAANPVQGVAGGSKRSKCAKCARQIRSR